MNLSLIVLTNFYPAAQRAVRYADDLASTLGARLVLLHVERAFDFDPLIAGAQPAEYTVDENHIAAQLSHLADKLQAPAKIELAPGLFPDVAHDLARQYHPAVFVVGMPAPDNIQPEEMSTTALHLLRTAQLPVLLVPIESPAPSLSHRVVVAADSEEVTLTKSAAGVEALLGHRGVELTVACVSPVEDDQPCTAALQAVQHSGLMAGIPAADLRGYRNRRPVDGIMEAIRDTKADLVVVLARTRSFLGELFHCSTTAQIISQSPVPVLIVPATGAAAAPLTNPQAQEADCTLLRPSVQP